MRDSRFPRGTWIAAGIVALAPLVRLADVDEERRLGGIEELAGAHGVHLLDLGLDLLQQLAVARHDFQNIAVNSGARLTRDGRAYTRARDRCGCGRARRRGNRDDHLAPDPRRDDATARRGDEAQGRHATAHARLRRPQRSGGGRTQPGRGAPSQGQAPGRTRRLRALPLRRRADRRRLCPLAGGRARHREAARGSPPAQRIRAAPPSAGRSSGPGARPMPRSSSCGSRPRSPTRPRR